MRPYTQYNSIGYGATEAEFLADDTIWGKNIFLYPSDKPTQWKKGDGVNTFANLPYIGGGDSSGVQSVTGNLVSGTSSNPVVSIPDGNERKIVSFDVSGKPISSDLNWQLWNRQSGSTIPFDLGAATTIKNGSNGWDMIYRQLGATWNGSTVTSIPIPSSIPVYNSGAAGSGGGTLTVEDGRTGKDAVNITQMQAALLALYNSMVAITATLTNADIYQIPEDTISKVILTVDADATGMPTIVLPENLGGCKGMEIVINNFSPDRQAFFKTSDSGQLLIFPDTGTDTGEHEISILPQTRASFSCNGTYIMAY